MNLLEKIKEYENNGVAMGHFNVGDFNMLKAVYNAAKKCNQSVVVGTSEGERDYLGLNQIVDMIKSYNRECDCELFLNADHTHSIEGIKKAVKAGYDSVIFDASNNNLEINIKKTREAVKIAKEINKEVLVEGELGYIGGSSKILDKIPENVSIKSEDLPTAKEAKRFVNETGIDLLAPAAGNIHGMLKNTENPNLNIQRIKQIKEVVKVPLVLHGGSGLSNDDFRKAIKAGISLIHVSTEIRKAWRKNLGQVLKDKPDEITSYKVIPFVVNEMEKVIKGKIKLFCDLN